MLTFNNTLKTKEEAVALAQFHQDADNYIQRTYWKDGKGCSVGCMVKDYKNDNDYIEWHEATEALYGIPRGLSYLQDRIFEGLDIADAKKWTVRFFNVVPENADLSMITSKMIHWVLTDPDGIIKFAKENTKKIFGLVANLYERRINGDEPDAGEWSHVREQAFINRRAADAAAYAAAAAVAATYTYAAAYADAAADAAAAAVAAAAADADADADADAAAYAYAYAYAVAAADADADAAAYAYAYAAAYADAARVKYRREFYNRMADKLIELLEAA